MPKATTITARAAVLALGAAGFGSGAYAQGMAPAGTCGISDSVEWIGGSEAASDITVSPFPLVTPMQIAPNGEAYRAFRVSETAVIRAEVAGNMAGDDSIVTVYDASGALLGSDDDGGGGLDSRLEVSLAPGTYCLSASGYGAVAFQATAQIGRLDQEQLTAGGGGAAVDVVCEPSTPAEMADFPARFSATAQGEPFHRFTLSAPTPVTVTATNEDADPVLRLFDSGGVQIAENDDFDGLNARIDVTTPLPAGEYCVGLSALSDTSAPVAVEISSYDESAYLASLYDRAESAPPNDGSHPVQDLGTLGTRLLTDIGTTSDATWLAFEMPDEGLALIQAVSQSSGDPYVVVFDELGRRVGENDDANGLDSQLALKLSRGSFMLAVYEVGEGNNRTRVVLERFVPAE